MGNWPVKLILGGQFDMQTINRPRVARAGRVPKHERRARGGDCQDSPTVPRLATDDEVAHQSDVMCAGRAVMPQGGDVFGLQTADGRPVQLQRPDTTRVCARRGLSLIHI